MCPLTPLSTSAPPDHPRFRSEAECRELLHRLAGFARGGGYTAVYVWSTWTGNTRWARNRITSSGEVRNDYIKVVRNLRGAECQWVLLNDDSDAALVAAVRRAERLARLQPENGQSEMIAHYTEDPAPAPQLFFEATYQLDPAHRAAVVQPLIRAATAAGMLSAGYIAVSAHSMAVLDTMGHGRYLPYTVAQCSLTVRDPQGTGSGWAGVDWADWTKIDGERLAALAMDKCVKSRHPVVIEPGRYTTILEAQAVCDLVHGLMENGFSKHDPGLDDKPTEGPFGIQGQWGGKIGQRVVDARITISEDPLSTDAGYPQFNPWSHYTDGLDLQYDVYHPVTWIREGVLQRLALENEPARRLQRQSFGQLNSGAFQMTGGETSIAEMIATTKRGLLVTRFSNVGLLDFRSQLYHGYTRDGVWLIENGAISKAVCNLRFVESILGALNNIEQLGVPQRVFHPKPDAIMAIPRPNVGPPLKIRDFSFTALSTAV